MRRLEEEYGIKYYDYSEDPFFQHRQNLFTTSDHLNINGARIFSRRFKRDLEP